MPNVFEHTQIDNELCITKKKGAHDANPDDLNLGAATAMATWTFQNAFSRRRFLWAATTTQKCSTAAWAGSGPASLRISSALGSQSIADGMSAGPGRIHGDPAHAVTVVTFRVVSRHSAHAFTDLSGCVTGAEEFQQGGTNFLFFS